MARALRLVSAFWLDRLDCFAPVATVITALFDATVMFHCRNSLKIILF